MFIFKLCAGVLSIIALITGTVLAIPQSRAIVYNAVAPYSNVYEQQQSENQELETQKNIISNEIVNLQNQKEALEDAIEILESDSTVDRQTIQDYMNEVDELNRQIQMFENITVDMNNGSITYMGSYDGIFYWVFDDNDMPIYQTQNAGTHYGDNQYMGEHLLSEIDYYLSEVVLMNKSLTLNYDNFLYGYNVYQIVIGPYGIMWDQYNVEHRFATNAVINLDFTFNTGNITADDLKTLIDNYSPYNVKTDYSFNLDGDGLISDVTCNFKVSSI